MAKFLNTLASWLVIAVLLYNLVANLGGEGDYVERRPAVVEEVAPLDPQDLPVSVVFEDDPQPRADGIGTAFAIADGRLWATARHVVGRCDAVYFVEGDEAIARAERVVLHRHADVAVLAGTLSGAPLPVAPEVSAPGDYGYHYGFPQDQRVAVRSRLVGVIGTRTRGDWTGEEPMAVWVEEARAPRLRGTLGGMSGGPVLNAAGSVVGITVREDARRGRILSAHPDTLAAVLRQPEVPGGVDPPRIDPRSFAAQESALIDGGRVRQLWCDVAGR
jgi:S1-C subfamily serine protease